MIVSRFRRLAPVVALVALVGVLAGCDTSSTSDAATVTYKIGETSHTVHVTRSDFQRELRALAGTAALTDFVRSQGISAMKADQKSGTDSDFAAIILSIDLEQVPYDAEFQRLGLTVTDAMRSTGARNAAAAYPPGTFSAFPKWLQNKYTDQYARREAVDEFWAKPDAAKVKAFYDAYGNSLCPSQRIVSHILVKDEATARAILDQVKAGASFAGLARTKSIDTQSAQNGGLVGCLQPGIFVNEFENAANVAPYDVPTGPVHTKFGYHVILVQQPTFDAVRSDLTQAAQQGYQGIKAVVLLALRVKIDPRYGTAALRADQQGNRRLIVSPPVAPNAREQREKPATTSTSLPLTPGG